MTTNYFETGQEDFCLSNEAFLSDDYYDENGMAERILFFSDVKEFIKRLKEELFKLYGHETGGTIGELNNLIDKLAGDKLI